MASSFCFNLDIDQPTTFHVDSAGFGYSVVQYANWLVVGAPQEIKASNQTGGLYQCDYSMGKCEPILLPEAVNMSLGLSMVATTSPFRLLACGPTVHHACRENMHLTGFCFLLVSPSRQAQRIPAALQECPRQEQDIAFLIDGSGSISSTNFAKMLNFVKAMMSQFQSPSSQFSLVQFSDKFQVHFTFKAFAASSNPLSLLNSVQKLSGYTYTATAIKMVTEQLFSALYGARKDASKILIVITDGQKKRDPLDYKDVIPSAEAAGVIRYAIGVGLAFQNIHSWQELKDIASKPSHEHIFKVENFDALRDIQNQLKEKIFAIEGTQTISSSSFEMEMSQEGFSAVFMPVTPCSSRSSVQLVSITPNLTCLSLSGQRVTGAQFSPSLQYFGQSLSGGQDLTMDGLVDLAVGAWGHALLLRTRPVLRVWANIHITPPEITRSVYECHQQLAFAQSLGEATVCLRVSQSPKNRLANLQSVVTFDLTLDPGRLSPRAVFEETRTRNLTRVRDLGLTQHCEPVRLLLPACVEDSVTPIILRLNFSLVGKPVSGFGNLKPMLAVDAQRYFTASLPFEKNCGADHVCQDDLGISFGVSGLKTLIVGSNLELNLEVRVWNDGEDSYGTTITFFYPPGLSYRRVAGGQNQLQSRALRLTCDSAPTGSQGTLSASCSINNLIFREGAQITFRATFDVSPTAMLGGRLLLAANVSSENNAPKMSKTTFRLELPVKYAVYTMISSRLGGLLCGQPLQEPCTQLEAQPCSLNPPITPDQPQTSFQTTPGASDDLSSRASLGGPKGTSHPPTPPLPSAMNNPPSTSTSQPLRRRKAAGLSTDTRHVMVNNLGHRDLPVSIDFSVPVELNRLTVWKDMEVLHPQNPSIQCSSERTVPTESDFLTHFQKKPVLDCSIAACLRFRCDIRSFGIQEKLDFILKGNLSFGWVSQTLQKKVLVVSVAEITFNRSVYSQLPGQEAFLRAQMELVLEKYEVYNPIPIIVGSSVGGLLLLALITAILYKVGFFKRQYKEMMEGANGQTAPEDGTGDPQVA
ncbi:hypothetical protein EI555_001910, partial [Monodon monoceros]